jgi:general secretion pathway protein A
VREGSVVYLDYYGLAEKPFNLTPDPRFLYFTEAHREGLAQLEYGVKERRGFLVLTGEAGTGKTTLLRALLERIDRGTEIAYVFNSMMPYDEILEYILEDFGVTASGSSRAQRLFALNGFLTERCREGMNAVLIIDEAQNLDAAALEQIRMLSNFETVNQKLLQILLVGQPELKAKLQLPELRQLKQRIGLRCTIHPLTAAETADYIRHRLRVARGDRRRFGVTSADDALFTDRAMARIAQYSEGLPRTINVVCDHCLLIGYADQVQKIDRKTVDEAINYLEEREGRPLTRPPIVLRDLYGAAPSHGWVVPVTTLLAFGGVVYFALSADSGSSFWNHLTSGLEGWAATARDWLAHALTGGGPASS